jgi:hypothetical protein
MVISIPRSIKVYHKELHYYNEHTPESSKVQMTHTIGDPFSYMRKTGMQAIQSQYNGAFIQSTNDNGAPESLTVGVGDTGISSLEIEVGREDEYSLGYSHSFSIESESKVGANIQLIAGANFEHTYGYTKTTTTSKGTTITGEVATIPASFRTANSSRPLDFDWGFFMYNKGGIDWVTYWVDPEN